MQAKTLHEIVPDTQACVDCGEDLEWLVEGNMPYRMLPDVILIGIAAAGLVATLFQIVPWAQDSTARQSLDAVRAAESTAFNMDHQYSSFTGLVAATRIQDSRTLAAGTDSDGTCFVGIAKSATGKIFFITDTSTGAAELTRASDPGCVDAATLAGLVDDVGGIDVQDGNGGMRAKIMSIGI